MKNKLNYFKKTKTKFNLKKLSFSLLKLDIYQKYYLDKL